MRRNENKPKLPEYPPGMTPLLGQVMCEVCNYPVFDVPYNYGLIRKNNKTMTACKECIIKNYEILV